MDSMFVDEGFGSLDEDALEQALKALLQLTEGNRLVGIISHVSELKDQIDKKIIVTKQRTPEGISSVATMRLTDFVISVCFVDFDGANVRINAHTANIV